MSTVETDEDDENLIAELPTADGNAMWAIFRQYVPGYRAHFAVGGLASIVARFIELLPALILGIAIDTLFRGDGSFLTEIPGIPASAITASETEQFLVAAVIIASTYIIAAMLNWVNSYAWNHFAQHLQHEVRTDTYDAVQELDMSFFDDHQTGEIMSVLNNDVNQLEEFFTRDLNSFIRISILIIGVAGITLWVNWQFALVALLSIPALAVASHLFVQIIQPKYQKVRSTVGKLNARLENNIGGIDVVKAYNQEGYESERVNEVSQDYLNANWDAITTRIKFFPSLRVITGIGFGITFLIGGWWVLSGPPWMFTNELSLGFFVTFLLYSRRFLWPMRQFGEIINDYEYARAASERVFGLTHYTSEVADSADATELETVRGNVEYEDIVFQYNGNNQPAINHVSFSVSSGETIGLVGATGAGKTTLMRLLLRFYQIDDGKIRIDGQDISAVTKKSLRSHIGYVSQDPFLFQGTVRENITYGVSSVSDSKIWRAAQQAGALSFIESLQNGLDTIVGERGVKLSGGQRQRIALARALIKDPEILILDEATSHVDNETEIIIKNNLEEVTANRTTFVVAHRLSTVRNADRILVLDEGQIVESGTHEELLAENKLYANLWAVQVGKIESLPEEFVSQTVHREATSSEI